MSSKRMTSIILVVTCFSLNMISQTPLRPRGDVNCDWEVTIADVNILINSIMSGEKYHPLYSYAHDVNGDQEITIADVNAVIGAILGDKLAPMPSPSGTLPVMYVNTDGYRSITGKEKEDYLQAEWWIDAMGVQGYESLGDSEHPLGMVIKGRGNYTWEHMDKKPYRLKFDTKQKPLGMKRNRHFCLLGHDLWTNPFGFELSRRIGLAYTPAQEPVEVVLNGQYIGLYFLTEIIRVGKNRVNIVEQKNGEEDADLITGGWLLEIGNRTEKNQFVIVEGNGRGMGVEYHSPDSLSSLQLNYIKHLIEETDSAIYASDSIGCGWGKYIDTDTLACFYIVNEIADDIESFSNSLFIHKQRGDSTKLMFGPVWDFGCSFGRPLLEQPCFIYENITPSFTPHWLGKMLTCTELQAAVKKHWKLLNDVGALETMETYMDSVVEKINPASVADSKRWPENYIWYRDIRTYYERYYRLKMREKINFLHEQWDSRDMGDLLTPFTRKPDPNADYQEYCGLSHVIKDGKIIYKGMRYNPDNMTGVDEVVADMTRRPYDPNYYNLTGQSMGVEVPTTPGIYIHNGKKIVVR